MEGTSRTYKIKLQNVDDEERKAILVMDSEITEIIDYKEIYILPKGVSNTPVVFNVTAPKNAMVGDEYSIGYYVEPLSGEGGAIQLGIRMNKQLKVKIVKNSNKFYIDDHFPEFAVLGALLALFIITNKKKRKKAIRANRRKRKKF